MVYHSTMVYHSSTMLYHSSTMVPSWYFFIIIIPLFNQEIPLRFRISFTRETWPS